MDEISFKYQKEGAAKDLVLKLIADYDLLLTEALDVLYSSKTYKMICNPKTGLYFQGPEYLYSFLKEELEGKEDKKSPTEMKGLEN